MQFSFFVFDKKYGKIALGVLNSALARLFPFLGMAAANKTTDIAAVEWKRESPEGHKNCFRKANISGERWDETDHILNRSGSFVQVQSCKAHDYKANLVI